MASSSAGLSKSRRILNYSAASIIILMTALSADLVRSSVAYVSTTVFYAPFFKLKSNIEGLRRTGEENRLLRNQLAQLSLQLGHLSEAEKENRRLRDLIGFGPPEKFRTVPVKIYSLVQHFYPVAAVIDKGSEDGLSLNMTVINRYGLVGRVKELLPRTATVQLITDPGSPVSGRVASTRQIGIVKFSPKAGMYLDNLPADAEIKKGDLIITSGLGGIYPAGLPVAVVDSIFPNVGDILKAVRLKAAADFFKLDELYVLMREY